MPRAVLLCLLKGISLILEPAPEVCVVLEEALPFKRTFMNSCVGRKAFTRTCPGISATTEGLSHARPLLVVQSHPDRKSVV